MGQFHDRESISFPPAVNYRFAVAHSPFTSLLQQDLHTLEGNLRQLLKGHLDQKTHRSLLNMACGRADETGVLARVLSDSTAELEIHGLDIRAAEITQAQSRWSKDLEKMSACGDFGDGKVQAKFQTQRGDRLRDLRELSSPDLAFLRHQNFWNDVPVWRQIFEQSLERLNEDGLLVITSYFDQEHELAVNALLEMGAIQVSSLSNAHSRKLSDAPGKSVDRHLAVFRKG